MSMSICKINRDVVRKEARKENQVDDEPERSIEGKTTQAFQMMEGKEMRKIIGGLEAVLPKSATDSVEIERTTKQEQK